MDRTKNPLARFFGVILKSQTYLNLLYLLLAFPLGLLYFIFLVFGLTLGITLSLLLIGFFILAAVAVGWWAIASFERYLAIWLLRVDIEPMEKPGPKRPGAFGAILDWFTNPVTWKSLVFILLKLPLGLFTFIILVTLGGLSLGLAITPLVYGIMPYQVELFSGQSFTVDSALEAAVLSLVGVLLGFVSLNVFNYLAYAQALWAQLMLGNPVRLPGYQEPVLPLQPVSPVEPAPILETPPPPFYEPHIEAEDTPPHGLPVSEHTGDPVTTSSEQPVETIPLGPPAPEPSSPPAVEQGDIPAERPQEILSTEETGEPDFSGEEALRREPPEEPEPPKGGPA